MQDALPTLVLGSWEPSPWASWTHTAARFLFALGSWVLSRCRGSVEGPGTGRKLSFRLLQPVSSKPGKMGVSHDDSATSLTRLRV